MGQTLDSEVYFTATGFERRSRVGACCVLAFITSSSVSVQFIAVQEETDKFYCEILLTS